jgi:SAM-dependent methyltransferase
MKQPRNHWPKVLGIDLFKVEYWLKRFVYKTLGYAFPKLKDQRDYWQRRGNAYMDEILASGYLDREIFFQDMIIEEMRHLGVESCFEAGCGFGWNILRAKQEFPDAKVGGVDFSLTQLSNAREYTKGRSIPLACGDNRAIPLKDNAFDIGFSLGVFMNIHPRYIRDAASEMLRVCGRYVIHVEYDETRTTPELREKRAHKTNIVSHDYKEVYESLGAEVISLKTHHDFGQDYREHEAKVHSHLDRWEGFEGAEKYIFVVVKVP